MYYYIFDIKKCKKRSQVENIKNYLGFLGISGEFTYPTAAQNVKELVNLGLSKQYTTIVAIGSDDLANAVASMLVGRGEALGLIPMDTSPGLAALIGTTDWKTACEILRYRKINEIKLGRVANGECFLTNLYLNANQPVEVTIEFRNFIIQALVSDLQISNFNPQIKKIDYDYLDITFRGVSREKLGLFSRLGALLSRQKNDQDLNMSLFRGRSLRLFTKNQIPLTCGSQILAKTPQLIESTDEDLRLITAKKALDFWLN